MSDHTLVQTFHNLVQQYSKANAAALLSEIGGKALNLVRLSTRSSSADDVPINGGFIITTNSFTQFLRDNAELQRILASDGEYFSLFSEKQSAAGAISEAFQSRAKELCSRIREIIISSTVPDAIAQNVRAAVAKYRDSGVQRCAVRSSGTTEDSAESSFAGQYDTYLNVECTEDMILEHVKKCWASAFSDRAVLYQLGMDTRASLPSLAVVVMPMIFSKTSGIVFTANPVNSNREQISISATFGLGEAVVAGMADTDEYVVDRISSSEFQIIHKSIGQKQIEISASSSGDSTTEEKATSEEARKAQALSDAQILQLAQVAVEIETLNDGIPQDIEFAFDEADKLFLLQTRPITTLLPLPEQMETTIDQSIKEGRVVFRPSNNRWLSSLGHDQNMLLPMKPLGASCFGSSDGQAFLGIKPTTEGAKGAGEQSRSLYVNGRVYMDLTDFMPKSSRPIGLSDDDVLALRYLLASKERARFSKKLPSVHMPFGLFKFIARILLCQITFTFFGNTDGLVKSESEKYQKILDDLFATKYAPFSGTPVCSAADALARMKADREASLIFNDKVIMENMFVILPGMTAASRLHKEFAHDERAAAFSQGIPGNVVTEQNLHIGDMAIILQEDRTLYDELDALVKKGNPLPLADVLGILRSVPGVASRQKLAELLCSFDDKYGMRGIAEIDITRPRHRDDMTVILRTMLSIAYSGNAQGRSPREEFADKMAAGEAAAKYIVDKMASQSVSSWKNWLSFGLYGRCIKWYYSRQVLMAREPQALREHAKYYNVQRLSHVVQMYRRIAQYLVEQGYLSISDDIHYLFRTEVESLLRHIEEGTRIECCSSVEQEKDAVHKLIARRRADFKRYETIQSVPPILTHTSENVVVSYAMFGRDKSSAKPQDKNKLSGLGVSAGVVTGRARVVSDPHKEQLAKGEILVARYSDPAWTALFLSASAVVLEVGNAHTHGSTVARELGLPAVVSVRDCTLRIKTGMKIRVDGNKGEVEILGEE